MKLTSAQEAEYLFLRQQVDRTMDRWITSDQDPMSKNQYYYAKKDLADFVSARRKEGYTI
jgi:hypothetical protein